MNAAIPDKVAPNAAPAAYPLLFDDDVVVDDDDVEEGSPLKNDDELHELNEEVEDSAAAIAFAEDERRDEDLAAKTPEKRFAALLNMMISQSIKRARGD